MEDTKALMKDFETAKKTYEELVETKGRALLAAHFALVFKACPSIEKIRWTQYTPYFNDGEPCEFSVGDRQFKIGDDWLDAYDNWPDGERERVLKADKVFDAPIFEDVFEVTFGDHTRVTVLRDGTFEVEEYEHD